MTSRASLMNGGAGPASRHPRPQYALSTGSDFGDEGSVPLCHCGGASLDHPESKVKAGFSRVPHRYRISFYAIIAFYMEVLWAAMYDYVMVKGDPRLVGWSSVWCLVFYLILFTCLERLYLYFAQTHTDNIVTRGVGYMIVSFVVELACGLALRRFNARPWNYGRHYTYHLYGSISFAHAPLWFFGALLFERFAFEPCTRAAFHVPETADVGATSPKLQNGNGVAHASGVRRPWS